MEEETRQVRTTITPKAYEALKILSAISRVFDENPERIVRCGTRYFRKIGWTNGQIGASGLFPLRQNGLIETFRHSHGSPCSDQLITAKGMELVRAKGFPIGSIPWDGFARDQKQPEREKPMMNTRPEATPPAAMERPFVKGVMTERERQAAELVVERAVTVTNGKSEKRIVNPETLLEEAGLALNHSDASTLVRNLERHGVLIKVQEDDATGRVTYAVNEGAMAGAKTVTLRGVERALTTRVQECDSRIAKLKTKLEPLIGKRDALEAEIGALRTELQAAAEEKERARSGVEKFENLLREAAQDLGI